MAALSMTQQCLGMEDGFPAEGSTEEKLKFLIQYAILSPSVRNSQPWTFKVEKDVVHLSLDRSHAKRTSDPDVRELTISCGAALKHLCIAAWKFGHDISVQRLPAGKGDLLATVRLGEPRPPTEMDTILFYAIHKWLAVPKPFRSAKRVPSDLLNELNRIGNATPTWLHLARAQENRDIVAGIFAQGDELQRKAEETRASKPDEVAWAKKRRKDKNSVLKMDVADGAGHIASYIKSFFQRAPSEDTVVRKKRTTLAETEPVLAILGTAANDQMAWLTAGERLAEILLRGMAVGVRASLMMQPADQPEIREKLMKQLEISGYPQVLFRLGFPDAQGLGDAGPGVGEQML